MPDIPEQEIKDSSYLIIRHAYSIHNFREKELHLIHGDNSEEYKQLRRNKDLYDVELHQLGLLQAQSNQDIINKVNFKKVFVSPLRRTIQTTIELFKSHSNKQNIQFTILPIIREILDSSNDIAMNVSDLIELYSPQQERCKGLKFDFSLLQESFVDPNLWQVYTLYNDEKTELLIHEIRSNNQPDNQINKQTIKDHKDIILKKLIETNHKFEYHSDMFQRAKTIKQFFKTYLDQNPLNHETQEKYGIVAHSRIIMVLTSDGVDEQDNLINPQSFKNCEMRAFNKFS
eukprot:403367681